MFGTDSANENRSVFGSGSAFGSGKVFGGYSFPRESLRSSKTLNEKDKRAVSNNRQISTFAKLNQEHVQMEDEIGLDSQSLSYIIEASSNRGQRNE